MNKKYGDREKDFPLPQILSGFLGFIFGEEFGRNLFEGEFWKKGSKGAMLAENLPSEQKKILNLLSAAEIQRTAGSYDSLKKTCSLILALLKDYIPRNLDQKRRNIFLYRLSLSLLSGVGDFLAGKGLFAEALKFYQELFALYPGDFAVVRKMARTFYTMGPNYLSEAEKLYRQALADHPDDLEIAENLGRVLNVSPGGLDEARIVYRDALLHCRTDMDRLRFYARLLELSPGDGDILLRMGRLYRRQGMFIEAKHFLEKAKDLHSDPWEALDLAYLYYLLNDFRKAEALISALTGGAGEAYLSSRYLLGLIREGEERWEQASEYFEEIPPESSYYWRAQAGLARVYLYQGNYLQAESLARMIAPEQHANLGTDFLELCEMLENALQRECYFKAEEWREHVSESVPSFHLKKAVHKRSMGPNFWRKYEAFEVIGNGPAGQILLGRERQKGYKVAIKYLPGDLLEDPLIVRRMQGILKSWRNMEENNSFIVRVYEDCFFEDSFFYAMEYMERNLASVIKTWAPAPTEIVTGIAVQICDALAYYYRYNGGIAHGALKPENILFSINDELKISGFDFFWVLEGKKVFSTKEVKKHAFLARNLSYSAPERLKEKSFFHNIRPGRFNNDQNIEMAFEGIDQRADFYSLGVILFELATGFLPFDIQSRKSLFSFQKAKTRFISHFNKTFLHPELTKIIKTLMARDPAGRFSTPAEVKEAIQTIQKRIKTS